MFLHSRIGWLALVIVGAACPALVLADTPAESCRHHRDYGRSQALVHPKAQCQQLVAIEFVASTSTRQAPVEVLNCWKQEVSSRFGAEFARLDHARRPFSNCRYSDDDPLVVCTVLACPYRENR